MKTLFLAVLLMSLPMVGHAQDSCSAQSTGKKLAGAAQTSFMKRCETDTRTRCTTQATDRKLNGAARNSFVDKCVRDGVG